MARAGLPEEPEFDEVERVWQRVHAFTCDALESGDAAADAAADGSSGPIALPALQPVTMLGALLADAEQLEKLHMRIRLSNEELRSTLLAINTRRLDRENPLPPEAFEGSFLLLISHNLMLLTSIHCFCSTSAKRNQRNFLLESNIT